PNRELANTQWDRHRAGKRSGVSGLHSQEPAFLPSFQWPLRNDLGAARNNQRGVLEIMPANELNGAFLGGGNTSCGRWGGRRTCPPKGRWCGRTATSQPSSRSPLFSAW